jgi:two-component system, OmpR family, sensor histidine kinase BaeS
VVVGATTALVAGELFTPHVVDQHAQQMGADPADAEDAAMLLHLQLQYRAAFRQSLLWSVLAASAAAALVGVVVAGLVVPPLAAMRAAAQRIAGGRYEGRLDTGLVGEIGALAASFNTMAAALDESEVRRRQLLSDLAHEVRTPLSNLRGYLEGIEDGVFTLDAETGTALRRQLDRLERLTEDLAILSPLDEERVSLRPLVVSADELVASSAAAFRPRFEREGVDLVVPSAAKAYPVFADPARLGQVLENLLDNALRYTPPRGRVDVRVSDAGAYVRFEVHDTGPGVPEPLREAIFRRFVRLDPARTFQDGRGSGLGLTIAKELVERQGGTIGVTDRPEGGSVFWFTLPAEEAAAGTFLGSD